MRDIGKSVARAAATIAALPMIVSFWIRSPFLGRNRALEGSSQLMSLFPGLIGDYLRRAFLSHALASVHHSVTIQFGTIFSQSAARLDANVYIGPRCHIGRVHLEKDVLLAAGVHIPSGGATHGTALIDKPIREQQGSRTLVTIGEGTWIGSNAVVMADVGRHCVIAAGAVVTKPMPDYVVAGGVPAKIIRDRRDAPAE